MSTKTILLIRPSDIPWSTRVRIVFHILTGREVALQAEEIYPDPKLVIP